jgi:hypothetical protein
MKAENWFNQSVTATDMFHLCAGKKLGEGVSRVVYECPWDKTVVFKFETHIGNFANVAEWKLWEAVQYVPNIARWFAPCVAISPNGCVLIQKKTKPLEKCELPTRVPQVFTDIKVSNWGLYKGQPVCHDYALNQSVTNALCTGSKFRKARWVS